MISFSVIIPVHNEVLYLRRSIRALLAQDFPREDFEIIFIDNNSTDGSFELLKSFEPQIRVLQEKKSGSYAARNLGIRAARGKYVAFTDADCEPSSDWLLVAFEEGEREGAEIIQGKNIFNGPGRPLRCLQEYEDSKMRFIFIEGSPAYFFGHTNNMVVRKSVFDRVGVFKEELRGMDTEFIQRCTQVMLRTQMKYVSAMRVRHLEIQTWMDWNKKMALYSHTAFRLEGQSTYKSLSLRQRREIVKMCWQENKTSGVGRLVFMATLFVTGIYFEVSRFSSRFEHVGLT